MATAGERATDRPLPRDLERSVHALERALAVVSASIILAMMLLTTADVALRFLLNSPIPGAYELSEFLLVGVVFLAISYVQAARGHIMVDLFTARLPLGARLGLDILGALLALAVFSLLAWQAGYQAWRAWAIQDYSMGLIAFPLWPARTALAVGVGLYCVRLILDVVGDSVLLVRSLRAGGGGPA